MKERLINWLKCPSCKGNLILKIMEKGKGEIKEGILKCTCGKSYKITNYIPRFVDTDNYVKNFSFEWTIHRTTQLDHSGSDESRRTFLSKTGFCLDKLKGKLVLDAGCGSGRFMDVVERSGGEIIGFDLSYSVDAAFKNVGSRKNVHIVQADIFNLPFKEGLFDYIYSIGVLQFTTSTKKSFLKFPKLLKKEGWISIWVYQKQAGESINRFWRSITTRLPRGLLHALCHVSIPLYHVKKIPLFGNLLQIFFATSRHKNWKVRVLDTFDWYSPKYQWKHTYPEVFGWFEEAGLKNIRVLDRPISVTGKR